MILLGEIPKLGVRVNWSIVPASLVSDNYKGRMDERLGSLLIIEADKMIGLVSDGASVRKLVLTWKPYNEAQLREIIIRNIIRVHPDRIVEECQALTESSQIRHIPVILDGCIAGLISMKNLSEAILQPNA